MQLLFIDLYLAFRAAGEHFAVEIEGGRAGVKRVGVLGFLHEWNTFLNRPQPTPSSNRHA